MKLFSLEKSRFRKDRITKLGDANTGTQNSVQNNDCLNTKRSTPEHVSATVPTQASPELLSELQSAASMIMDREECESLFREIEQLRQSHPVAA